MKTAVWWIRRDLRLNDNQILAAALKQADYVLPVFVVDPALTQSDYVGDKRLAFLWGGLRRLDADLKTRGSRLLVRYGDPLSVLSGLVRETGAFVIVAAEDVSPYARRRDKIIADVLPLQLVYALTVFPPGAVLKANGSPYTVFTPFSRVWKALPPSSPDSLLPAPEHIPSPPAHSQSSPIPSSPALPDMDIFIPGEAEAHRRLEQFKNGAIFGYGDTRNRVDLTGTSGLSPYLRFGMVSIRQVVASARQAIENAPCAAARQSAEIWLNELIWREFYVSILHHFPQVRQRSFRPAYDRIRWSNDFVAFAAWTDGRTGYPIVDAAMRQLSQTGWMHNRARMITASFLVKDLLIDWRWGERWFMRHLVDGDPAANNGGWQWTAGVGTDAAPYFRIFNPVLQSKKFDPAGAYIRRWLPELAAVPDKYIHTPWKMPVAVQQQSGCMVGRSYPQPIIDHKQARERALVAYRSAKQ
jgi:deoxyribodipyrimidine photo-lyase